MKLALGTVQFGMNYGISNKTGQPTKNEVSEILSLAKALGITLLDTAGQYGESEKVLGEFLPSHSEFEIITKGPTHDLINSFHKSLENLRRSRLYGFLIHDAENLTRAGGTNLFNKMIDLKQRGLVKRIGASVCDRDQIERVIELSPIDLIQLPLNVFSQSLYQSGYLKKLAAMGIEIHVRSVLLQGLLLMSPESLPEHFHSIKDHLARVGELAKKEGLSIMEVALGFVAQIKEVSGVVVGVNSAKELKEVVSCFEKAEKNTKTIQTISEMAMWKDEKLFDPRTWGKNA